MGKHGWADEDRGSSPAPRVTLPEPAQTPTHPKLPAEELASQPHEVAFNFSKQNVLILAAFLSVMYCSLSSTQLPGQSGCGAQKE